MKNKLSITSDNFQLFHINTELSFEYRDLNLDTAYMYLADAKKISQSLEPSIRIASELDFYEGNILLVEGKYDSARNLLRRAINGAQSLNHTSFYGKIANNLGMVYRRLGLSDSALFFYSEALVSAETGSYALARIYTNMSMILNSRGELDSSSYCLHEAITIFEGIKHQKGLAVAHLNLGNIYYKLENDSLALFHYKQSLMNAQATDFKPVVSRNYLNIGSIYNTQNKTKEAKQSFYTALEIQQDTKDRSGIAASYRNLGDLYFVEENYDSAQYYYKESLRLFEELGNVEGIIRASRSIGEILMLLDKPNDAIMALEKARELAYTHKQIHEELKVLAVLKKGYLKLKNLDSAYLVGEREYMLNDSIFRQKSHDKIAELQTKYETEKKDQEIGNLNQQAAIQSLEINKQRNQMIIGGLFATMILVGWFLYYRQDRAQKEKASAELQQRFLRSQLNPHFIFNSMTAIQHYLETHDPEGASHYMGLFSTLMRQILENSRQEFISLAEEVSMLENYLQLQQMRFGEQFDYKIDIDEELDEDYAGVPPMFAQPFIENSLEHGLFREEGVQNRIQINFKKINDHLVGLEIEDSGVGVKEEKAMTKHKSLATKITNERLNNLRTVKHAQVGMDSENILNELGDTRGYRINLRLPTQLISI
ncbi:tetratricopeptide repeat protein [Reichenbachiella agariperforans]|uniref:tetratricopeptide repeat protein n=1 Tax=Reichenbachiella agariperforans TaxID=156994 RepID=UPI001C08681F|nr:tetratricopeptide repeat protein [Reichenbachiella agariperforans]MBU2914466.1 tetratricopeptide repeat protein [Reichenbachiella agariperforans]